MQVTYQLKNRHTDELGWRVSQSGGICFSSKCGMKSIPLKLNVSRQNPESLSALTWLSKETHINAKCN